MRQPARFRKWTSRRAEMRRLLAFAIGLFLAIAVPAQAEERITSFVSDVTVNANASLLVRETIVVAAEGRKIKRGILRDFPTTYTDRTGQRVRVGFAVESVSRDGRAEPYVLEDLSNGTRIRIGEKNVLLEPGLHRYEISYRTTRQIGFFTDFDELYWNVTGNGWTLPILEARAIIQLPTGAQISRQAFYTGVAGATGTDAAVLDARGNHFEAVTTRTLSPGEGFTVAVAWQKGIVTAPETSQELGWWMSDNAGFFVLGLGLVTVGLYFVVVWNRVGRDPAKGTIIPIFSPPKAMGPAAVRFVRTYGADDRGFAAALVGLAVKGCLRISDDGDDGFAITKTEGMSGATLTASERALFLALPPGNTELRQSNHVAVRAARNALETALADEYEETLFRRNLMWFAAGLALSLIFLLGGALLLADQSGGAELVALGWMAVWWGIVISIGWAAIRGLFTARKLWGKISSLAGLLFLIPFIGGGLAVPISMFLNGDESPALYVLAGAAVLMGLLNVLFYHLLRAPTVQGRQILDQIEGFRLYLSTAEEDRLNVLHPPEKTPELFERYLPYAMALDCANAWNAKFAAVLAAAAAAGAAGPAWYAGRHGWGGDGGFAENLGEGLATSAAAASTAPGRISGSGGGGSSGGGGGGGGGSGW